VRAEGAINKAIAPYDPLRDPLSGGGEGKLLLPACGWTRANGPRPLIASSRRLRSRAASPPLVALVEVERLEFIRERRRDREGRNRSRRSGAASICVSIAARAPVDRTS